MISISESAAKVLAEGLLASGVPAHQGLRLTEESDRLTLALDTPNDNDRVVSLDGQNILIINHDLERRFGDAIIYVGRTQDGLDLILHSFGQRQVIGV